jgi:D-alanyl-D-alanine carboxypeptidase/D-alanyl-D-alanine-endopeptidase (penicillin-binding protein 4)
VLGACGGGTSHRARTTAATTATTASAAAPAATSQPVHASEPPPDAQAPPPSPQLHRLQAALAAALRKAGPHNGAEVYDLTAASPLFSWRSQTMRPPASLEKLYTTTALLGALPPSFRVRTTVLGAGHLSRDGTWQGDLYLRGGGDPTFGDTTFNHLWNRGYGATTDQLTAQLLARRIRRVSGRVIADESLFDSRRGGLLTAFRPDIPDFGGQLSALTYDHGDTDGKLSPAAFAVRQLTVSMRNAHIEAAAAGFTAKAPRHAKVLASVHSPALTSLIDLMNFRSDNLFAELLTKQLGRMFGNGGTTDGGASVVSQQVARYGIHPKILDGSGLSHDDRSSPHEVVTLLSRVSHTLVGRLLLPSLPVVGVNGTARVVGHHTAAQGNCIAKTGTLDYVTNLAGVCHSHGGHVLAFAFFLDGPDNDPALHMLGPMVAAVARY